MGARNVAGFVDAGMLRTALAQVSGTPFGRVRLNAAEVVDVVRRIAAADGGRLLRVYWYERPRPAGQRQPLGQGRSGLELTPGVALRLGRASLERPTWHRALLDAGLAAGLERAQLEVALASMASDDDRANPLLAVDLLQLAHRGAYDLAVVFGGDESVLDVLTAAQQQGRRVAAVMFENGPSSPQLYALADVVLTLDAASTAALHRPLLADPATTPARTPPTTPPVPAGGEPLTAAPTAPAAGPPSTPASRTPRQPRVRAEGPTPDLGRRPAAAPVQPAAPVPAATVQPAAAPPVPGQPAEPLEGASGRSPETLLPSHPEPAATAVLDEQALFGEPEPDNPGLEDLFGPGPQPVWPVALPTTRVLFPTGPPQP